jgi:hypothetical protein
MAGQDGIDVYEELESGEFEIVGGPASEHIGALLREELQRVGPPPLPPASEAPPAILLATTPEVREVPSLTRRVLAVLAGAACVGLFGVVLFREPPRPSPALPPAAAATPAVETPPAVPEAPLDPPPAIVLPEPAVVPVVNPQASLVFQEPTAIAARKPAPPKLPPPTAAPKREPKPAPKPAPPPPDDMAAEVDELAKAQLEAVLQ